MVLSVYDVVVCGGGPAGVAAAVRASRLGLRVLLIERYGFVGGMATAALVNPWTGHVFNEPATGAFGSLIRGLFEEFALTLHRWGGYGSALTQSAFDDELLKCVYDQALLQAGVAMLLHTQVTDVEVDGDSVRSVTVYSKGGKQKIRGRLFIDATGDGDVAAAAGCENSVGRDADGKVQALTTSFRIGGVDKSAFAGCRGHRSARRMVEPFFQEARKKGRLNFPFRDFVHFYDYPRPGILHFNMTRINDRNPLVNADLAYAEVEGRRQALEFSLWLIKEVPWFRDSYLEKLPAQVGVRESRHVVGLYTMTRSDIVDARKHADAIARSRYFVDIHSPVGSGFDHEKQGTQGLVKQSYAPPPGDWYEIPYRAIVPQRISNLLVACRALSATHEAHAAVRVMATMTAVGEAAGLAAALAFQSKIAFPEIDGCLLRRELQYLDAPPYYGKPWCYDIPGDQFAV